MMTRWKVSYSFSSPVVVQRPMTAYSDLGVSLYYESDTKLVRVEHELDADDKDGPSKVIGDSQEKLKLFWELLHYQRGIPLPINDRSATKLDPGKEAAPVHTGWAFISTRLSLCKAIAMPDAKVFTRTPHRLLVWLRLANDARDPNTPDVDAIRNYYMIWEDLPAPHKNSSPTEANELRLVRNFVSHGSKLGDPELLKFIKSKCKKPIDQFDPTDQVQQDLVLQYRTIGRELIEAELDRML